MRSFDEDSHDAENIEACTGNDFECELDYYVRRLTYGVAFFFVVYFIGSLMFLRIGFQQLREKQYLHYRMANIQIRLQVKNQLSIET